jgi:hypothetical protein
MQKNIRWVSMKQGNMIDAARMQQKEGYENEGIWDEYATDDARVPGK